MEEIKRLCEKHKIKIIIVGGVAITIGSAILGVKLYKSRNMSFWKRLGKEAIKDGADDFICWVSRDWPQEKLQEVNQLLRNAGIGSTIFKEVKS